MKLPLTLAALALSLITFAPAAAGQGTARIERVALRTAPKKTRIKSVGGKNQTRRPASKKTPGQEKTCSCAAPDNKCSVKEIRCPHGCTAVCAPGEACFTSCRNIKKDRERARVSIKIKRAHSAQEIEKNLSRASKKRIKFIPRVEGLSFQLDNGPLWDALVFLNLNGKVFVNNVPFDNLIDLRERMRKRAKIGAINYTDIPVKDALADLSFISGLKIRAKSGNAKALLSFTLPDTTLEEVLSRITKETGVRIETKAEERASVK